MTALIRERLSIHNWITPLDLGAPGKMVSIQGIGNSAFRGQFSYWLEKPREIGPASLERALERKPQTGQGSSIMPSPWLRALEMTGWI